MILLFFFFNDTATTEIYTLSLHDALPIPTIAGAWRSMICCRHSGPWSSCNRATGRVHIVSYDGEGLTGTESIVVSLVLGHRHGGPRLSPAAWSCRMTSQPLAEALEE